MSELISIGHNIWIYNGPAVPFFGMPYTTRSTIIKLSSGELWVHSPGKLTDGLLCELTQLGEVKYLISPNKLHHLFMGDWQEKFPTATLFASPGVDKKRPDLKFHRQLDDTAEPEWQNDIDQLIFKGSAVMEEVVFFHKKTSTLILTDLIENFHPNHFSGFKKVLAKITGVISPNGKTPIDWRASFIFGKQQARACFSKMADWQPQYIVIAHGECIEKAAEAFLHRSFSWLGINKAA
ncbi:DUF4336 domain-containing protein [Pseudoalteromonas sp. S4498]|uniref:DUF4336 domain-containing protein n=1 Tax=Pseudoalteromonas galatheae TaxID=579562 RepID=UPI001107EB5F|nr:DUF4336 domain-containing protein [Pseudoalteromonas galatheae]NKC21648.1 DUF4336 domain-containing protein [Pseudoalteromonas galatheae]